MAPLIRRGDAVVTAPVAPADQDPPMPALYRDERGDLVTHRIVDRLDDGSLVTRGDANTADDTYWIHLDHPGAGPAPADPGGGPGGGTPTIHLLQVGGLEERDVHVEARLRVDLATDQQACVATRMRGGLAGDLRAGCLARSGAERNLQLLRTVDGETSVLHAEAGAWTSTR